MITEENLNKVIAMLPEVEKQSNCLHRLVGAILWDTLSETVVASASNYTPAPSPCVESHCCTKHNTGKCPVIHAEVNCILSLLLEQSILIQPSNLIMVATYSPCYECSKMLVRTGIKEIYFLNKHHKTDWDYLNNNGIKYTHIQQEENN